MIVYIAYIVYIKVLLPLGGGSKVYRGSLLFKECGGNRLNYIYNNTPQSRLHDAHATATLREFAWRVSDGINSRCQGQICGLPRTFVLC